MVKNEKKVEDEFGDVYLKNIAGGTLRVGKDQDGKCLFSIPLNSYTVVSKELMKDRYVKRALDLKLLEVIDSGKAKDIDIENKIRENKNDIFAQTDSNPLKEFNFREAIKMVNKMNGIEELEDLMTKEDRTSVLDAIEKRIDELEEKDTTKRKINKTFLDS